MAHLYDHNNALLTPGHPYTVQQAIPRPDVLEIEHRLLDGSFDVTIIGDGATVVDVIATLSSTAKQLLDTAKRIGAPVKVTKGGRWHKGPMRGQPAYQELRPNLYRVQLTILQQDEGAV